MAEIPMFIRKGITDVICNYLVRFEYSDASVKCIEKSVDPIVYIIKEIYKKLWHFAWQAYECGRLPWRAMKGTLTELWKGYFSENMKTLLPIDKRGQKIADVLAEKQERMQYFGNIMKEEENEKQVKKFYRRNLKSLKCERMRYGKALILEERQKKLTPMDVYAVVHEYVIRVLND